MSGEIPLSIVIPTRGGLHELRPVLDALGPEVEGTGAEVGVVGPRDDSPAEWVRIIPDSDGDVFHQRLRGIHEARGDVVAIGEDHAVPTPGWGEAVVRAHAEHPD